MNRSKFILLSLSLIASACASNYENSFEAYAPVIKADALRFRNREFIEKDLKDWTQVASVINEPGNFTFKWIPKGQFESSATEVLEINSRYINPRELSQHIAIETRDCFLRGMGEGIKYTPIEESELDVTFEVIFRSRSAGEPIVFGLIRMVHDKDSIKQISYTKKALNDNDVDRETWIKNIKKLDVALSRQKEK